MYNWVYHIRQTLYVVFNQRRLWLRILMKLTICIDLCIFEYQTIKFLPWLIYYALEMDWTCHSYCRYAFVPTLTRSRSWYMCISLRTVLTLISSIIFADFSLSSDSAIGLSSLGQTADTALLESASDGLGGDLVAESASSTWTYLSNPAPCHKAYQQLENKSKLAPTEKIALP